MKWVIANLTLALLVLATDNLNVWSLVVCVWLNIFLFAVDRIQERPYLAAFLVSFFLFLISRPTLERFFNYQEVSMDARVVGTVSAALIAGMLSLVAGYLLGVKARRIRSSRPGAPRMLSPAVAPRTTSIRKASLFVFYICMPGAFFDAAANLSYVSSSSYTGLYTEAFLSMRSGMIFVIARYCSEIAFVALALFLATWPTFQQALLPIFLWVAYSSTLLFTGRRREVAILLVYVLCYAIIRARMTPLDPWITKRRSALILLSIPGLMLLFAAMESWRGLGNSRLGVESLGDFVYGQGVSVRVLENVVSYGYSLPKQSYLMEFAHEGILARVLGFESLGGNSIARAMEGGSLSHSLSYVVLGPETYLSGIGTGTSFIAEAYVEAGLVGIVLVSLLFGWLLSWLDSLGSGSFFSDALRLIVAPSILWAPRGSSTGFISTVLAPSTFMAFLAIMILAAAGQKLSRAHQLQYPEPSVHLNNAKNQAGLTSSRPRPGF